MTREEAREELITFIGTFECPSLEAVEVAIEALTAEPKRIPVTEILNYLDVELHPIVSPEHWRVYSELYDMISSLPSADRLQTDIVRCKDCKYWHSNTEFCSQFSHKSAGIAQRMLPDDFCSYGERKE